MHWPLTNATWVKFPVQASEMVCGNQVGHWGSPGYLVSPDLKNTEMPLSVRTRDIS